MGLDYYVTIYYVFTFIEQLKQCEIRPYMDLYITLSYVKFYN